MSPVPSLLLKVTLYSISSQIAFTSMSPLTVIFSPTSFSWPFTDQDLNIFPFGAVNSFTGSSYSVPFLTVFSGMSPVPSLLLKVTLYSISFQIAVTSVFPFTVILSPTNFVSLPIFQPTNFLFLGGVNPFSGRVHFSPFLIFCDCIVPSAPFELKVTVYFTSPLFIFKVYSLVFCEFFEIILKFKTFFPLFKIDFSVINP